MLAFHNEHITSCAFLTYFGPESAINAQGALHEKQTSPGVYLNRFLLSRDAEETVSSTSKMNR